ncbi:predicted protein [Chaetomium globosum CBS 148.51]|uniref:Uncharacterized protein n=1 Tax=Chaetomium globosum (strain ATCC 6205 / CBS 148.51 / DSM 1962 / NBRC 6347 / NRRL 1970) TaxID=306901 RepID=Q2HDL1_CHAGB|nr:uncharacterized protein CHGG_01693 [Chaetomium globosum CBS 148.51]EAQ93458.1 predicted protein [Chaetomium globosum CBS 148.51]
MALPMWDRCGSSLKSPQSVPCIQKDEMERLTRDQLGPFAMLPCRGWRLMRWLLMKTCSGRDGKPKLDLEVACVVGTSISSSQGVVELPTNQQERQAVVLSGEKRLADQFPKYFSARGLPPSGKKSRTRDGRKKNQEKKKKYN